MITALALFLAFSDPAASDTENDRYADCLNIVEADVSLGRKIAQQWADTDSGIDAQHCLAVADIAAGFYRLAAIRLDELARRETAIQIGMSARLYQQAAEAWIEEGEFELAKTSIANGLEVSGDGGELFLVSARVNAKIGNWRDVILDVNAAEKLGFSSSDGYVDRARAHTKLGDYSAGAEDVVRALSIDPKNIDALVLRGEIQQAGIEIEVYYDPKGSSGE